MNKILVITTEGCAACNIIKNIFKTLLLPRPNNFDDIAYEVTDVSKVDKNLLKESNVTDFPTTLLIHNGEVVNKIVGTKPKEVLKELIVKYLHSY